ncbi:regulator of complement activation group 2 gene 1 isoform X2 [Haplochromis burtoni]|uniref:regulator of complement activation group 2 gene 1 isoform X2 n=1 Tax=Haplochromis burtoni TaxID=8153 RepID=UPI001C2D7901|nr:regulator of complement activation group 2 gene 1 isoform X2 [Haplochromis burtoni]
MAITAVLLLSSLGFLAITAQAQNCSRPPKGENMDLKGNDILLTSFPDGTTVTFACNTGYESAGGSPRITCTAGSWSSLGLKCQRKNCGPVGEVENGHIEYRPGTEFGDTAVLICDIGHMPVGGGKLTCGTQGWMGRLPVCEVTQCESPPVVQDGSFSPNREVYDYKDTIVYTCKSGYTRNGSRQLHCSDDGTFKPEPPKCIKVECGDPEISFGQLSSGARPPYGYSSTVTLQCNAGYTMIGSATVMCGLNSQWWPGLPQCIPQNCSRPFGDNMDLKGNDIFLTSFPDGTTVTFACNTGYESAGESPHITCTAGSWSPLGLKCQRKNCFSVEDVQDGQIEYRPGAEFGDKAVLICNIGYMPVGGGELTCGTQGWLGRLPVCEVTQCESPPVVQDGSFSPNREVYDYKDTIVYTCKSGYTRNGSRQLHCSDDGTFKPEPPKCIKVECGEPEISFGQWSSGARPPYGYLSTVTLRCNTGYKMIGSATVTCELNSQWSPALPQCIPNPTTTTTTTTTTITTTNPSTPKKPTVQGCEDPRKRSAQVTVSPQPPYRHGVKVTLGCSSGYKLNGPDTQTCENNGLWSPGIPECTLDNGNGSSKGLVIGIVVVVIGALAGGFGGFMWYKKNSKKGKRKHDSLDIPQLLAVKTAS